MKKIICFDNWTKGANHFERLTPIMNKAGYKLMLIHVGSWGHDMNRPKEEYIKKLQVRDISYYKKMSFFEILKNEKPELIIFLSTRSLPNMSFNRCANYLGISTCHLYHALVNAQPLKNGEIDYSIKKSNDFIRLLFRFYPAIRYIIPEYLFTLLKTKAPLKIWFEFLYFVIGKFIKNKFLLNRIITDSKTSIGCVYSNADIYHMKKNYGLPINKIFTVGIPDFIRFKFKKSDLGSMLAQKRKKKNIIYLETGLLSRNLVYKNKEEFVYHIHKTKKFVEKLGFSFKIKLKPHSNFVTKNNLSLLRSKKIEICKDENFLNELKQCCAIITEPSTVAILPAALGLPLFLANFGPLKKQKYGKILTTYPKKIYLNSLSGLTKIKNIKNTNKINNIFRKWSKQNLGPFPSNEMPKRFLNAIKTLIK